MTSFWTGAATLGGTRLLRGRGLPCHSCRGTPPSADCGHSESSRTKFKRAAMRQKHTRGAKTQRRLQNTQRSCGGDAAKA